MPYQEGPHEKPILPPREHNPNYHRAPIPTEMYVPDHYANVAAEHAERMEAHGGEASTGAGT